MQTQSPAGVPSTQSRTWSIAADAAEAADDAPRALMIAAPRCCTVGMNVLRVPGLVDQRQRRLARRPCVRRSGYCVAEWLPQIVTCGDR